jgi:hypothetical protein
MISRTSLTAIIDLINDMNIHDKEIQNVLESSDTGILSEYSERIQTWLLSELGVPEDNTLEMIEIHGYQKGSLHKDTYCRDFIYEWFIEYEVGNMTKEKLIYNLLNLKS